MGCCFGFKTKCFVVVFSRFVIYVEKEGFPPEALDKAFIVSKQIDIVMLHINSMCLPLKSLAWRRLGLLMDAFEMARVYKH